MKIAILDDYQDQVRRLGYVEQNSYELYFRCAFENINAFANGKAQNIANPETLSTQISAI